MASTPTAMARSIGDHNAATVGVIAAPEVTEYDITDDDGGAIQARRASCGMASERPTMPACELGEAAEGRVINLSYLASEAFWWMLRDVRVEDERRTKPLHRWFGPVPCECVRQAVAVFSLQESPSPAACSTIRIAPT